MFELPALQHDPGDVNNTSSSGGPSSLRHQPLRLTDLATLNERNQQHLIQSWVGGGDNQSNSSGEGGRTGGVLEGASSVTQHRQSPGNTTPSLFSPSFLESLQQDDDRSPHPQHEFMQQDHHPHSAGFSLHHQQQQASTDWSQHDHTFPEFTTPNFSVDTMVIYCMTMWFYMKGC